MLNRDARIGIPCPECGHKIEERIGRLKEKPDLTCPECGTTFVADGTHLEAALQKAEKLLKDTFGRFRK